MVEVALADDITATLQESYLCPVVPERPATLPADDKELLMTVRIEEDRHRGTSPADKVKRTFGHWRYAVLKAECEAARRLRSLLYAHDIYQRNKVEHLQLNIEQFIRRNYGLQGALPHKDDRRLGLYVQRLDIMSMHLRHLEMPRSSKGVAEAADPGDGNAPHWTDEGDDAET